MPKAIFLKQELRPTNGDGLILGIAECKGVSETSRGRSRGSRGLGEGRASHRAWPLHAYAPSHASHLMNISRVPSTCTRVTTDEILNPEKAPRLGASAATVPSPVPQGEGSGSLRSPERREPAPPSRVWAAASAVRDSPSHLRLHLLWASSPPALGAGCRSPGTRPGQPGPSCRAGGPARSDLSRPRAGLVLTR